ncbi:unnamed protein product [Linum trigynum]|uniref:Uncharacterized protein n=1 Tax=Linum trigynum TaxID=586398 RepID=A0AAV2FVH4_9ROSI
MDHHMKEGSSPSSEGWMIYENEGSRTPDRAEDRIPEQGRLCPPPPPRKKRASFMLDKKKRPTVPKEGYFNPPDLHLLFTSRQPTI